MPVAHLTSQSAMNACQLALQHKIAHQQLQYHPGLQQAEMPAKPYFMGRAKSYAEQGDKLIERMAFWSAFGVIGAPIMSRLADRLERVTDEVDSFVRMAA